MLRLDPNSFFRLNIKTLNHTECAQIHHYLIHVH